jgi:hypothetical protein
MTGKTNLQKKKEAEAFAKNAMCCDGKATLIFKPITYDFFIEIKDSAKGTIRISWSSADEEQPND